MDVSAIKAWNIWFSEGMSAHGWSGVCVSLIDIAGQKYMDNYHYRLKTTNQSLFDNNQATLCLLHV